MSSVQVDVKSWPGTSIRFLLACGVLACAHLIGPPAQASSVTILESSATVDSSATASNGAGIGVQFTLNQTTTITEVETILASAGANIPANDLYVQFYTSNSNNTYGTYINQLAFAPSALNTSSFTTVDFTNNTGVTLMKGTYFLFLFDSSSNAVYWQTNNGTGDYSTQYGSISGTIYAGGYYTAHPQFTMLGSAVPEPSSLALLALGAMTAGAWKLLMRKRMA